MTLDPQIIAQLIGPPCGAFVTGCWAFVAYLRYRERMARMAASPAQKAAADELPPIPAAPSAGPMLALILGGSLAIGLPVARGQAHPERLLGLLPSAQVAEVPAIAECNSVNCPTGKCVNGHCQQLADKPALLPPVVRPKKTKAQRPPARADASPLPDATLSLPPWTETEPSAFAGRMPERWGRL